MISAKFLTRCFANVLGCGRVALLRDDVSGPTHHVLLKSNALHSYLVLIVCGKSVLLMPGKALYILKPCR